jgi:hypothetical protein
MVAKYRVVLSLMVEAETAREAFNMVERDVKRHLYLWPCNVEAATQVLHPGAGSDRNDGSGGS